VRLDALIALVIDRADREIPLRFWAITTNLCSEIAKSGAANRSVWKNAIGACNG